MPRALTDGGRIELRLRPDEGDRPAPRRVAARLGQERLQGLARPCSDLSRGASTDDIINVAAITALQAGSAP